MASTATAEQTAKTEKPPCPACGREEVSSPLVYEASIHSRGQVVGLSRCPDCRLHFTRPRLVEHNVDPRVTSYDYILEKYRDEAEQGNFHKNSNYALYLSLAQRHLRNQGDDPPYRVLDIGSHCGFFLRFASELGWHAQGIEPAPPLVRFAREVNRVEHIEQGFFDERSIPGERFHLVTMFDVLEHIPEPTRLLSAVRERLADGGLVLCKVPHVQFYLTWRSAVAALGRVGLLPSYPTFLNAPPPGERDSSLPGFFDLFEHVVHYDANAVEAVFSRAGFRHWKLLPAPPTNPRGHYLNLPRSGVYQLARAHHAVRRRPGALTHGLLILAW